MIRSSLAWLLLCLGAAALAQDAEHVQVHGFVTQSLLYSKDNNYLIADSNGGSVDWSEAVVSITDRPVPKLRIGLQLHYYRMSDLGADYPLIDWASGDYQFNPWLGVRAGKVKTPLGLFNDTQDIDPVLLWGLLPQSIYANDNRNFYLSHYGGEVYGKTPTAVRWGGLSYRAYGGPSEIPTVGGYGEKIRDFTGLVFDKPLPSKLSGADLRWQTPYKPLLVGFSFIHADTKAKAENGSTAVQAHMPAYYARFESGRYYLAGEYRRNIISASYVIGTLPIAVGYDERAWYAMFAYRVNPKLQVGTYYSHYNALPGNTSYAANNSKDLVFSGRYDFNGNIYAKAETHFLHGEAIGYYVDDNPNGLRPRTNLVVAKLGFSF